MPIVSSASPVQIMGVKFPFSCLFVFICTGLASTIKNFAIFSLLSVTEPDNHDGDDNQTTQCSTLHIYYGETIVPRVGRGSDGVAGGSALLGAVDGALSSSSSQ